MTRKRRDDDGGHVTITVYHAAPFPPKLINMVSQTQHAGYLAERQALKFLRKQGLKLICQNYLCRFGEIDIIMRDAIYLVFIEVRQRNNPNHGSSIESITYAKQQKIIRSAQYYLQTHPQFLNKPCRLDAIGMAYNQTIVWLQNAFQLDS